MVDSSHSGASRPGPLGAEERRRIEAENKELIAKLRAYVATRPASYWTDDGNLGVPHAQFLSRSISPGSTEVATRLIAAAFLERDPVLRKRLSFEQARELVPEELPPAPVDGVDVDPCEDPESVISLHIPVETATETAENLLSPGVAPNLGVGGIPRELLVSPESEGRFPATTPISPRPSTPRFGPLRMSGRTNEERVRPFAERLLQNLKDADQMREAVMAAERERDTDELSNCEVWVAQRRRR